MKYTKNTRQKNHLSALGVCLLTLISVSANADTTTTPQVSSLSNSLYFGIFGGGGTFTTDSVEQSGVAYKAHTLVVDANGTGSASSVGVLGGYVGYKWPALSLQRGSQWSLVPATEFEGYYLKGTQNANKLVNETELLPQHDFSTSYPMNNGVFLANAVLNFNHADSKVHPYVGAGLGTAIVSITGATSTQTTPDEPGVNHYNSDPDASDWTFAAQSKIGVRYDVSEHSNVFAEYRFLYLAPTYYTFGATQYPTHSATTDWDVNMGSMYYNMVTVGIQYDL